MGSTALATRSSQLDRFGDNTTFDALMVRGSSIYNISEIDLRRPENKGALMKAMQWTMTYGAMPGRHIHLIPSNKREQNANGDWETVKVYAVADSYEWRKASADQKALQMRWQYMTQTEQMTPEETRKYVERNGLNGPYDEADRGFKSRVLFMHEINMCKAMGVEYNPPWHYGFWRKNSYSIKEKSGKLDWKPDNVPSGRTPEWVAMKRAEKSALAQHFELQPIANWEQLNERQRIARIEDGINSMEELPPPVNAGKFTYEPVLDEDGVFVVEPPKRAAVTQRVAGATRTVRVVEAELEPSPTVTETEASIPLDILDDESLPEPIRDFVVALRSKETPGARKVSDAQHQYVVGIIEAITGKGTHGVILSVMMGRSVDSDSPLAEEAAKYIFKYLGKKSSKKTPAGEWMKIDNPDYDETKVEFVSWIWKAINED